MKNETAEELGVTVGFTRYAGEYQYDNGDANLYIYKLKVVKIYKNHVVIKSTVLKQYSDVDMGSTEYDLKNRLIRHFMEYNFETIALLIPDIIKRNENDIDTMTMELDKLTIDIQESHNEIKRLKSYL